MADKRITELTLRSSFSATCNVPVDDTVQTYRVTGAQILDFVAAHNASASPQSASYAIGDTDDVRSVLVTTGGTDRTVTLPDPSTNVNRILTIKKVDSGVGILTVDGNGANIDGYGTEIITSQYDWMTVQSDGTNWHVLDKQLIDYIYNSDTSTSDDSSSFAYGSGGVAFGSFTSNTSGVTTKVARMKRDKRATDVAALEVLLNTANPGWVGAAQIYPQITLGGVTYGMYLVNKSASTTDFEIRFGKRGSDPLGAGTYAANGTAWSSATSNKWRVKVIR